MRRFLHYVVGTTENIPKYFCYLSSLIPFFKGCTNRDKLEVWTLFRSLSRKLPDAEDRTQPAQWALFQEFRVRLKKEAGKGATARMLQLDEDALENMDLRDTHSQSQSQNGSQSQSQNGSRVEAQSVLNLQDMPQDMNINIEDDEDEDDNLNGVVVQQQAEEEADEEVEPEVQMA